MPETSRARRTFNMSSIGAHIFISHASEDRTLALLLKRLLDGKLRSPAENASIHVFCTSDIRAIEGGRLWFQQIMKALRKAQVCITVLTPVSIRRRWVIFESGGAFALSWSREKQLRMFPVVAGGLVSTSLPPPFSMIQSRDLQNAKGVRQLCREIAKVFGVRRFAPSRGVVGAVCSEARKGSPHWDTVNEVLVGERLDTSPFSLNNLLHSATRHILCAGQNLNYLASSLSMKRRLGIWLRENTRRRLQLLICDPNEKGAVDAWTVVGTKFCDDLCASIRLFKRWKARLRKAGIGSRLDIRVTKLVTTTVTALDPSLNKGLIVLTPVVFGKPISGERPHFVISRTAHRTIFDHYWETYWDVFQRARSIEKVSLPPRV